MSDRVQDARPSFEQYPEWLERAWRGDNRELRSGRFLHQQADLLRTFEQSDFWVSVNKSLSGWADEYNRSTGHRLFSGGVPSRVSLHKKPWDSFLNKTWRINVNRNPNWPSPPSVGWVFPDIWFEHLWDVVRARLAVRYLDGVSFLVKKVSDEARNHGVDAHVEVKAKDTGYYAVHVVAAQEFAVEALDYGAPEPRRSAIEIQVTTELQEIVGELTHSHFERDRSSRRQNNPDWQWEYSRPEFSPYYLGHVLHWVEGVVMNLRDTERAR